jgi:ParB-like chromosome segregation protein Spo0J
LWGFNLSNSQFVIRSCPRGNQESTIADVKNNITQQTPQTQQPSSQTIHRHGDDEPIRNLNNHLNLDGGIEFALSLFETLTADQATDTRNPSTDVTTETALVQNATRSLGYEIVKYQPSAVSNSKPVDPIGMVLPLPLAFIETGDGFRTSADADADIDLRDDIRAHGVISPIIVVAFGKDRYRTIIGTRRVHAARALGHEHIPARVIDPVSHVRELAMLIAEDRQRRQYNALELTQIVLEAVTSATNVTSGEIQKILHRESHLTAGDVPRSEEVKVLDALDKMLAPLKISRATFRRDYVPFLHAPIDVQRAVQEGLSHSVALVVSRVHDSAIRTDLIAQATAKKLSTRQVKATVQKTSRKTRIPKFTFAQAGRQIDQLIKAQPNLLDQEGVVAVRSQIISLLENLEVLMDV